MIEALPILNRQFLNTFCTTASFSVFACACAVYRFLRWREDAGQASVHGRLRRLLVCVVSPGLDLPGGASEWHRLTRARVHRDARARWAAAMGPQTELPSTAVKGPRYPVPAWLRAILVLHDAQARLSRIFAKSNVRFFAIFANTL